jgi:glutaredoxin
MVLALLVAAALGAHRWRTAHPGHPRGAHSSVVLYSVTGCGICKRLRGWLDERQVVYKVRDAEALTRDDLMLLAKRSPVREFPQLEIDGHFYGGRQEDEVKAAIDALE